MGGFLEVIDELVADDALTIATETVGILALVGSTIIIIAKGQGGVKVIDEMMLAGTKGEETFRTNYVVRQRDLPSSVAGNGDVPRKLSVCLSPMAGSKSVGCLVAGRSLVEFLHFEVGREVDDLEAGSRGLDAAHVLHAPRNEVAEQHDVVA